MSSSIYFFHTVIILLILFILILWIIIIYNKIIKSNNMTLEAWSGIDVQLKRRSNLIPNLVACTKGYISHEKNVLTEITQSRALCIQSTTKDINQDTNAHHINRQQAEQKLTGALHNLFAIAENYPDLKADKSFFNLQNNLAETENQIEMARRYYNGTIRDYNIVIQVFPNLILAKILNFKNKTYFEIEEPQDRVVPTVDINKS